MVSTALEFNSCLSRDIQQIVNHRFDQRYPFFAPDRFGFSFGIAGDQRAVGARRWFGFSENMNPVVDLFFEFVFVDEAVDLQAPKKWPMPLPTLRSGISWRARRAGRRVPNWRR